MIFLSFCLAVTPLHTSGTTVKIHNRHRRDRHRGTKLWAAHLVDNDPIRLKFFVQTANNADSYPLRLIVFLTLRTKRIKYTVKFHRPLRPVDQPFSRCTRRRVSGKHIFDIKLIMTGRNHNPLIQFVVTQKKKSFEKVAIEMKTYAH